MEYLRQSIECNCYFLIAIHFECCIFFNLSLLKHILISSRRIIICNRFVSGDTFFPMLKKQIEWAILPNKLNEIGGEDMRIGIVACEILKREIEKITVDDPEVVHKEYLKWGLHDYPDELRSTVIEKINNLVAKVDVIFLGYAVCKSLDSIPNVIRVPFVMLTEEDCIASMLGAKEYANERAICPGTWFSPPGWAELGLDAIIKDEQMVGLVDHGYTKLYFAKLQLEGYSRCLALDTGVCDFERYHSLTREFADQFGFRCDHRQAELNSIKEAWRALKDGIWQLPPEK